MIYKILRRSEWHEAERIGVFAGSPDDLRDGFIHFSGADQLRTTCDRHFSEDYDLLLVAVDPAVLGSALKWETSRGGKKFPHLYGTLPLSAICSLTEIRRGADARPIFPPEIP